MKVQQTSQSSCYKIIIISSSTVCTIVLRGTEHTLCIVLELDLHTSVNTQKPTYARTYVKGKKAKNNIEMEMVMMMMMKHEMNVNVFITIFELNICCL